MVRVISRDAKIIGDLVGGAAVYMGSESARRKLRLAGYLSRCGAQAG